MHIVDGALSTDVVAAGAVLTVAGVAIGLKKIDLDRLPQTGVLSAVFFIASLVHVPLGPSSVHLILNGLIGLALGWAAFPALLIALFLQAVFFGFGGLVVLGANTFNIALPALLVYFICGAAVRNSSPRVAAIWGAVAGALAIAFTALLVGICLALAGEGFMAAAKLAFFSHIPVMLVEGFLTGAAVYLLNTVKPDFFGVTLGLGDRDLDDRDLDDGDLNASKAGVKYADSIDVAGINGKGLANSPETTLARDEMGAAEK